MPQPTGLLSNGLLDYDEIVSRLPSCGWQLDGLKGMVSGMKCYSLLFAYWFCGTFSARTASDIYRYILSSPTSNQLFPPWFQWNGFIPGKLSGLSKPLPCGPAICFPGGRALRTVVLFILYRRFRQIANPPSSLGSATWYMAVWQRSQSQPFPGKRIPCNKEQYR